MRILARRGMLDRTSGWLTILYDPKSILLFQRVGDLHACALRRSSLWPEVHLCLSLVPLNGNVRDVHLHGTNIQGFQRSEVLIDAGADCLRIVFLFLTPKAEGKKPDECQ